MQGTLIDTSNTSILYSRLIKPGATGATVTTWSYGGHGALDLYNDKYLAGPTSSAGRGEFLSAMTDGGSGKLMVVLEEGTNDAADTLATRPSVHGLLPGNSPAAFQDNMASLIDGIKGDWATAGKNPADLSFLVLGMYEYGHRTADEQAVHRQFTQELEDLAHARSDVSFVDLFSIAPSWDQAFAMGYMADDVHPTILGATVYSQAIFDQIVTPTPEPAAGLILLLAAPLVLARRRGGVAGVSV
jgi:lysophospholipase L1-like esterase